MTDRFIVEADALCVQGHFPGMPVVPGAWLIGKVHAYLLARYPGYRVEALTKARFLLPLLPGQLARIGIDDSRWPRVQVTLERLQQALPPGPELADQSAEVVQILGATFTMAPVS